MPKRFFARRRAGALLAASLVLWGCGAATPAPTPTAELITITEPLTDPNAGYTITPFVTPVGATPTVDAYPAAASPTPAPAPSPAPNAYPAPGTAQPSAPAGAAPPVLGYRVKNSYPHDAQAFTQGLEIEDGVLYEGTGIEGQSTLRRVNLETGEVLQSVKLPDAVFGEGVTVLSGTVYQLTWQSRVGYVYDAQTFAKQREWNYQTEGWGLTDDGTQLIMSDGTPIIRFLDPATLAETRSIAVSDPAGPVANLNELEYINGAIYANIWQTDRIARIDPATGAVEAWIDLTGLLGPEDRLQPVDVLNGIAYDRAQNRLFVTGKLWPKLFEIEVVGP